MNGTKV